MAIGFLWLGASVTLLAISSRHQLKWLNLTRRGERILAFMLLMAANIVLGTYILSIRSLVSASGYLIIQAVFALVSWRLCHQFRKPGVNRGMQGETAGGSWLSGKGTAKWILVLLLSVIVFSALVNLFLAVYVPPNNSDSMTYHLSRVGYWLQQGAVRHYYTHKWAQNVLPPNAEILILWSVAFLKSDLLANTFQWLAYCGLGLTVFLIAGFLGWRRKASLFAALIFLSLPVVILESSTTQNDLVVTFFMLNSFYFFHKGIKHKRRGHLILSGIAMGLAVGTKYTVFFMLPAFGIASFILFRMHKPGVSLYLSWIAFCLAGVAVLGATNYFQNLKTYGNPIGPSKRIRQFSGEKNLEKMVLNAVRLGYDACDFRGLGPPLEQYLSIQKESLGKRFLPGQRISRKYVRLPAGSPFSVKPKIFYHEDTAWFGVIGFFFYLPAAVWILLHIPWMSGPVKDESWAYAFVAVFFVACICFMQNYDHWFGRYFILPAAFVAPITAGFFSPGKKNKVLAAAVFVSLLGAVTSLHITLHNRKKPIIPIKTSKGMMNVFRANDYQKRSGVFSNRMVPLLRFIEEVTRPGDRIGHVCRASDWDYVFFARDFSRFVIPVKKSALKRGEARIMEEMGLDYLVISMKHPWAAKENVRVLPAGRPHRFLHVFSRNRPRRNRDDE